MSERITDFSDMTCSAEALGQLLGLTRESIARLAKTEGMPKVKTGHYGIVECVTWALDFERGKTKSATPADKKARMEVAKEQALRYRIENAKNLSELLPAAEVGSAFAALSSQLASLLDSLAPRMAAELAAIDEPAKLQQVLFDECRNIRNNASAAFVAIAGDLDSRRDTETATESKRGAVG